MTNQKKKTNKPLHPSCLYKNKKPGASGNLGDGPSGHEKMLFSFLSLGEIGLRVKLYNCCWKRTFFFLTEKATIHR